MVSSAKLGLFAAVGVGILAVASACDDGTPRDVLSLADAINPSRPFVAYELQNDGDSRLCFSNLEFGPGRDLTNEPGGCIITDVSITGDAILSTSGKLLGFTGSEGGVGIPDTFYVNINTGDTTRITPDKSLESMVGWSDQYLYFNLLEGTSGNPVSELYRTRLDGSGLEQITEDGIFKFDMNLSPDGAQIAYSFQGQGKNGVRISDAETGNLVQEVVASVYGPTVAPTKIYFEPEWSPDGKYLLVQVNDIEKEERRLELYGIETGDHLIIQIEPFDEGKSSYENNTLPYQHAWGSPNRQEFNDNGLIVYVDSNNRVNVKTPDGDLVMTVGLGHSPTWSEFGQLLLWVSPVGGEGESIRYQGFEDHYSVSGRLVNSGDEGTIRIFDTADMIR